jgi:hypothetical protein
MVLYDFLKLLPHLSCQAPWSTAALNQLLGASGGKGACGKLQPHHTHDLTLPPQGVEGKQTVAHAQGYQPLGIAVQSAIAKAICREGLACIQSCQPYTVVTETCHYSHPKKGMRGKINTCRCIHRVGGEWWATRTGLGRGDPRLGGGQLGFAQAPFPAPPHNSCLTNWALGSQFLSQGYGPKKH